MTDYALPSDYVAQSTISYFDDAPYLAADIVHQPEVYEAVDYLVRVTGRTTVIDVGCGSGRKLRGINAEHHIGVDFGPNIELCRSTYGSWGEWHEADFSQEDCVKLAALANEQAVVVCADVVEHISDPIPLIKLLAACYARGAIVVTSTPDRIRVRGAEHKGPPPNPSHIREWALDEYERFLSSNGLPAVFCGYTINNNQNRELKTIVTIHDLQVDQASALTEEHPRPLAILGIYNESDVVKEVVEDLVEQGCDVFVLDNWSGDGSWEILSELAALHHSTIRVERFPEHGPAQHFEWAKILKRKEEIAAEHPGRWIVSTDGDEIRRSPFIGKSLAQSLAVARHLGANRINFTVVNFRPVDESTYRPGTLRYAFNYFEFGTRPGHFQQQKVWLQGNARVDLSSSGGHTAQFEGAQDFRYKFLLQHYPIRSEEHGRLKILKDRVGRWSPYERERLGWHTQYDHYTGESSFHWDRSALSAFDTSFWQDHGLVIMTDILERRSQHEAQLAKDDTSSDSSEPVSRSEAMTLSRLKQERDDLAAELAKLIAERNELRQLSKRQKLQLERRANRIAQMDAELNVIRSSTTWRLLDLIKRLERRKPTAVAIGRRLTQQVKSVRRRINPPRS